MIRFEWWWVALALPLPLVVRFLVPPVKARREAALKTPFIEDFDGISGPTAVGMGPWWVAAMAALAWILLVAAAARPQWVGDPLQLPASGRDLMLAVDLSGSMRAQDFQLNGGAVDRLTATKAVAGKFIERREGDRIGLILFGENAYLQTPLTFDRETVSTLLDESVIGLAGRKTAIGDAIALAVKRLRDTARESRVLILLTDGANTAGEIAPTRAAELAADTGLKIYTIGVGADAMAVPSLFGQRTVNPSQDLDEDTLRGIAARTGGRYFRARDTAELEEIYRLLDELEPVASETMTFRPTAALFHWPLAAAVMTAVALLTIRRMTDR